VSYARSVQQFIAILKQARLDKNLTQTQLGKLVGFSQKKIAMIENLTASPRLDTLLIIASALDLSFELNKENKDTQKVKLVWE